MARAASPVVSHADAGVSPGPDHERGLVVDLVVVDLCRGISGKAVSGSMMAAGVVAPDLSQPAEGGGVAV